MKSICLVLEVNQPFRHRRYRFFDIGNDHYYYDDYSNETSIRNAAAGCYVPSSELFLRIIEKSGDKFVFSLSISGTSIDLLELYAPETMRIFGNISKTGCVEFLAVPWPHSLVSLNDEDLFEEQLKLHQETISKRFDQKPGVVINSELIYSDRIGSQLAEMGFRGVVTEGPRHILGWKSPHFLYCNVINPGLKVLMRNYKLSDDLTYRFSNTDWSEFPLTADKFMNWLRKLPASEEVISIVVPFETFGIIQPEKSGIFGFLEKFAELVVMDNEFRFSTPSRIIKELQPVSAISVPNPVSWAGEERDLSPWLGNELQYEASRILYELKHRVARCSDHEIFRDWNYLQGSDHFRLMATGIGNGTSKYPNPFGSPYEAFINYMNILSDFKTRLDRLVPENIVEKEIANLKKAIEEKDAKIQKYKKQLSDLKSNIKTSKKRVK